MLVESTRLMAQMVKKVCLQCRRPWFDTWVGKFPWRRDRLPTLVFLGFPGDTDGKKSACNGFNHTVQSLGWEDPLEKGMATYSSILPGKSHGQRRLLGYSPWGCKESDMTEQLSECEYS